MSILNRSAAAGGITGAHQIKAMAVAVLILILTGCKIIQQVPEGGYIASASGLLDCAEGQTCVIDVENGTDFSENFTAIAKPGYHFVKWKNSIPKVYSSLCGGSTVACDLNVPGDFTAKDIDLYLSPVFKSDTPASDFEVAYQNIIDAVVSAAIPGVILLVETPRNRFLGSAGLANIETLEPLQSYHQMPTGSAGKPMIGLLATLLHTEGLLDLDHKISTWLSGEIIAQIPNGGRITLRQLLNHSSGIFDYTQETDFFEAVAANPSVLRTDIDIVTFGLNHPAYFSPGRGYKYSNTGYVLAGIILDKVLGQHHSKALRDRILTPLALSDTYYKGVEKDRGDFIPGYDDLLGDGTLINVKAYQQNVARANAPVVSTVEDLAVFLRSLIADDSFITQDIRDQMFGGASLVNVEGVYQYGLGIHKQSIDGKTLYFHAGGEPGYFTQNIYIPETQTSISALINCSVLPNCEDSMDTLTQTILAKEL